MTSTPDSPSLASPSIRLFVPETLAAGVQLTLSREASHYLIEVMRRTAGDEVALFDGRSGEWAAAILDPHRKQAVLGVSRLLRPRESVPDLWLLFAPIKKGRIDWIAEKACELGVDRLFPVITRRTIVERVPTDRLRAHMVEAAEQCGRTAVPELAEPQSLDALLAAWPGDRQLLFCDETGGVAFTDAVAGWQRDRPSAILIGPEGGFTDAERERIRRLDRATGVSLGPRVLRADTAAVAAISLWQALVGDWNG
ncbi:16S rRNA (uracil(1498)-N(3))-methyltransferase [Parapedomonas caeni]